MGNLADCEGNQNVGKDLIAGDLRLTEVSFTQLSDRTYLSVLAGLRRPLPNIINTAISFDSNVNYCVAMEPSELHDPKVRNSRLLVFIISKVVVHKCLKQPASATGDNDNPNNNYLGTCHLPQWPYISVYSGWPLGARSNDN